MRNLSLPEAPSFGETVREVCCVVWNVIQMGCFRICKCGGWVEVYIYYTFIYVYHKINGVELIEDFLKKVV
jgi:hypothetical protein